MSSVSSVNAPRPGESNAIVFDNVVGTYTTVRGTVNAVDRVNLKVDTRNIVGIAGESGCGKTTLMKLLYGNIQYPLAMTSGGIRYDLGGGEPITSDNIKDHWFKRISYVPQSSMSSLNPVVRIRRQFLDFQGFQTREEQEATLDRVRAYLRELDLPVEALDAYPHQLSGGMRQRVMVALATFFHPEIILADEPTTALDVVVQKGILLLLAELQERMKNTIFLVTHDMGVHYQLTHRMLIMYAAKVVEYGTSEEIFSRPRHPYTKMLIESLPKVGDDHERQGVEGKPPSLWGDLKGCRFADRCRKARPECRQSDPEFRELAPGHRAACFFPED
jgi:peptide/nickel transport system ATP-binding protein